MKILYFADFYVGSQLYAPCVTMFIADDEHDDFIKCAQDHFRAVRDKITNAHIEAECSYRVRLALIGEIYRPGNYGEFTFADIFNDFKNESEVGDNECTEDPNEESV